jgi:sulfatase maturation enzyme AslB (radical SAM superfamily)
MATGAGLRSLDVIVTSDCNLRCAYCYQNAKTAGVITWGTVRPALDLLLESRRHRVTLLFIGGEPLLEFPLIRRAVRHVETHRRRNLSVEFALATNGTLIGEGEADFLARHDFDLQVSFDGVDQVQRLRGAWTGSRLDELIDRLRRDHPAYFVRRLSIATTVVARTVPFLARSVDYFLAKGVPDVVINPALTHQPDWRPASVGLVDDAFSRIYRSCLRRYRQTGLIPLQLFRRRYPELDERVPGTWMCGTGRGESLTVDVDGELSGCVLFARSYQRFPETPLGRAMDTLRLGPIGAPGLGRRLAAYGGALKAAGLFDGRERKYSSYGACAACDCRSVCSVCPVCIVHQPENGDPNRIPDFVCAFNRVAAAYRRRFPVQPDARMRLTGRAPVPALVQEVIDHAEELRRFAGRPPVPRPAAAGRLNASAFDGGTHERTTRRT